MKTYYEASSGLIDRSAIALGFFDGVHLGHQVVIGTAVEEAKKQGLKATVVTFKDHPRTLTQGARPLLLTPIDERLLLCEQLGIEAVLVLSFTEELCRLSPSEYVQNILIGAAGAKLISVGYNHHFGRDREGNPELLTKFGKTMGFQVTVAPPVFRDGIEVSSSRIREAIAVGDMDIANKLLSRPYTILGKVISGSARGRSIGFPTANISVEEYQVIPAQGVYIGQVRLAYDQLLPCVINIGTRPTFKSATDLDKPTGGAQGNKANLIVEVHILNFDQDIYDRKLAISICKFLRAEQKFASVKALQAQISKDCELASRYFQEKDKSKSAAGAQEPEQKLPA